MKEAPTKILLVSCFVVTFQAYMIAPLTFRLATDLNSLQSLPAFAIPAFALPFGLTSFFYLFFPEMMSRLSTIIFLLTAMSICMLLISFSQTGYFFLLSRIASGIVSGGIVACAMSMVNTIQPPSKRRIYYGYLFLGIASGMTFGPVAGAYLYPYAGWQSLFFGVSLFCVILVILSGAILPFALEQQAENTHSNTSIFRRTLVLVSRPKGKRLYGYIYMNGIFHSGLFVWISYYFNNRYHFTGQRTGAALLLFGLPGLLLAATIGAASKKYGANRIVVWGIAILAVSTGLLLLSTPVWIAVIATGIYSAGYSMTQPLFSGFIETIRNNATRRLAMHVGLCILFLGYGTGPAIFVYLLKCGMFEALLLLSLLALLLVIFSLQTFKKRPSKKRPHIVGIVPPSITNSVPDK